MNHWHHTHERVISHSYVTQLCLSSRISVWVRAYQFEFAHIRASIKGTPAKDDMSSFKDFFFFWCVVYINPELWRNSIICIIGLIHMCHMTHSQCVAMCHMTRSYVVTWWHVQTCHVHDLFKCVKWTIHVCHMTHSHVYHDSFTCVTMCHMTHSYASRDTF